MLCTIAPAVRRPCSNKTIIRNVELNMVIADVVAVLDLKRVVGSSVVKIVTQTGHDERQDFNFA